MSKIDLNIALNEFRKKEFREGFAEDSSALDRFELTDEERRAIREADWHALASLGATTVCMGKMRRALGVSLMEIGAKMRSLSPQQLREFLDDQKERNARWAVLKKEG